MTEDQYLQAMRIKVNIQKIEDIEYEISSSTAFNQLPEDLRLSIVKFTQSLKDEQERKFSEL